MTSPSADPSTALGVAHNPQPAASLSHPLSASPAYRRSDVCYFEEESGVGTRRAPTREELQASYGATIPDLGGQDTQILLVGINPSLWSAWSGHHFARPGNRLWRTLHGAGLTPSLLNPSACCS